MRFKSDDTINAKGFSAAYVIIDDADNFDYATLEGGTHATLTPSPSQNRNNIFERKPPVQKTLT